MGKHLTYDQRCQLHALNQQKWTQDAISREIGSNQSVVSRELKRNHGLRGYRFKQAQRKADDRRRIASAAPRKMTPEIVALIEAKLTSQQWSPEQISGWLRTTQHIDLSPERIYQHIWGDKHAGGALYRHLRRSGKTYNKRKNKTAGRGLIPCRIDIDERPAIVDERARIGDWEADTIVGAEHKGAILSVVERVSRYTLLQKLDAATAQKTSDAMIEKMHPHRQRVHTITSDNGKEFAGHQEVAAQLKAGFYFAKPYHAWERGLNENTNGLVRQYFPKGTRLVNVAVEDVERVQNLLNARPRKALDFKSPNEVFLAAKSHPP